MREPIVDGRVAFMPFAIRLARQVIARDVERERDGDEDDACRAIAFPDRDDGRCQRADGHAPQGEDGGAEHPHISRAHRTRTARRATHRHPPDICGRERRRVRTPAPDRTRRTTASASCDTIHTSPLRA